jgi:hypothetical protein
MVEIVRAVSCVGDAKASFREFSQDHGGESDSFRASGLRKKWLSGVSP